MRNFRTFAGGLGNNLFQFAYIYAQAREGNIPDIYLQDPKYFERYKEEIRNLYSEGIEPIDMVSIHVRRGDYKNTNFYTDLTETDYYDRAMQEFPNARFLVFCADRQEGSDDISDLEWCKNYFQGDQFEFFQGKDQYEDFNAQTGCKGHITANSSFSWWSAYVGGGKTVCPSADKWFMDKVERVGLLEEWIHL